MAASLGTRMITVYSFIFAISAVTAFSPSYSCRAPGRFQRQDVRSLSLQSTTESIPAGKEDDTAILTNTLTVTKVNGKSVKGKKKSIPSKKGNGKKKQKHVRKPANMRRANGKAKKTKDGKPAPRKKNIVPILPLKDLKLGSRIEGRVAAFTDFGVFIKINYDLKSQQKNAKGGYALLHKSQIRDEPIKDLRKLFRIGNLVKNLRVKAIDYEKGEVGLSLREQRAKRKSMTDFQIGEEYEGKVSRVVEYGAFVDVGAKNNALLHISRISQKKIMNIRNWLNEGDKVNIRIIGKDEKRQTLAASMLDVEADEYMDRRSAHLNLMKRRNSRKHEITEEKVNDESKSGLKSELEYFEDAVRELENSLGM